MEFVGHGFSVMQWIHICFVVGNTTILYIDGHREEPVPRTLNQLLYSNMPNVALNGGGTLVLGQDQDMVGGGFCETESLSGAIANFQMFTVDLEYDEVVLLSQCSDIDRKPFLDFENLGWKFRNISKTRVAKGMSCSQKYKTIFLFHKQAGYELSTKSL